MISKKYRLAEKEVKKVLSKRKPFFAHGMVANVLSNTLGYARVAIVLGGKQAPGSVNRNSWRRLTYDISRSHIEWVGYDVVFVVKKWDPLDHRDEARRELVKRDIEFLWKQIKK